MHRVLDRQQGNQISAGLCALAIMTKAPRAGAVKTRLQPPLTPEEAADLNICFLRDIADAISRATCSVCEGLRPPEQDTIARGVGVFTPAGSEREYAGILPPDFDLILQRGDGFGEGLINGCDDLFDVDDRAALQRLCDELLGENLTAAPATKKLLADTIAREGRERIWPTAESTEKALGTSASIRK